MSHKYCTACGNDAHEGPCDKQALEAMNRNPFIALLMKRDGSPNFGIFAEPSPSPDGVQK